MKKQLIIFILSILFPVFVNGQVQLVDHNLDSLIRFELGLQPDGILNESDVSKLTRLDASALRISDISGLEVFVNLEFLNLNTNSISDISPLALLPNLRYVGLSNNNISDVFPLLVTLSESVQVDITQNCVTNMEVLEENLISPVVFIGGDDQKSDCAALPSFLNQFDVISMNLQTREVRFLYRGFHPTAQSGLIEFGNEESADVLLNGVTNELVYSYEANDNFIARLSLNGAELQTPVGLAINELNLILPENNKSERIEYWGDQLFTWQSIEGALSYEILISKDGEEVVADFVSENQLPFDKLEISEPGNYNWKVRALNGNSSGSWSEVFAFEILALENSTINFNALSDKTYGDSPFILTASASSNLKVAYSSSNTNVATVIDNQVTIVGAGATTITASQTGNENYAEALDVEQTLIINKAPLAATAEDKFKVYGEANPNFTVSYAGFMNGDDESTITEPVASTTADASSDVGTYDITLAGGSSSNYNIIPVGGNLTIKKAPLAATAEDKSKVYGEANPNFTISYAGFVNGDDESTITEPVASTTADASSDVGTYNITLAGGSSTNYDIIPVNGNLTINKAPLAATAEDKSKVYGEANPNFTVSYAGFVNGDDKSTITEPVASTTADTSSDVGTYNITLAGGSATNYSLENFNGSLSVMKASLTATAQDETINKGDLIPEFIIVYSGFVNNDDKAVFTTESTVSTTATSTSDRGVYTIEVIAGTAENYSLTGVNGTLTVTGPVYSLPSKVEFGDLTLGDTQSKQVIFENTGDGALNVTGIALPAGYVVDQSSFNVEAGANGVFTLTFTPIADQSYNGDIIITSNNGAETIRVIGSGQIVTGVDDEQLDIDEVGLFPNPADQWLVINLTESPASFANLSLVDLKGNKAWAKKSISRAEERVNVSTFSSGVYLLVVETSKGTVIKKVIVRH
ncbi:MBG domain-containing protein [uncultured Roseivirga sp.]|uniref:MBG domain-containing protein n=1 Tax=uncultured Roseivirga sp. TaxID=543088 RepID=UPI000D7962CE|nr:MBG domain-containing protein [uncultured Roseivirga sp.]PWL30299.1 MAG: hypothetical protein DCO95_10765 [Roseivirga sp. XM-24bin3]